MEGVAAQSAGIWQPVACRQPLRSAASCILAGHDETCWWWEGQQQQQQQPRQLRMQRSQQQEESEVRRPRAALAAVMGLQQ